MSRLVIFFAILLIWIVMVLVKAQKKDSGTGKPRQTPMPSPSPAGKKYAWAWMQTAGAMQLQFVRPDVAGNGCPAIRGSVRGIEVLVQGSPESPDSLPATVFKFHFPVSAKIGLKLILARNPQDFEEFSEGKEPLSPQESGIADRLPKHFLHVRKPEILKQCLWPEELDHLTRLNRIYPLIVLSDSELLVRASGINSDPDGFKNQLDALLTVAADFSVFSSRCAERKSIPAAKTPKSAAREPEKNTSESGEKVSSANAAVPPAESPAVPLRKHDFLQRLWNGKMSLQQQKEFFSSFQSAEVEWDGILKMAYPFSSDFIFNCKDGVKAIFELDEFKPDGSIIPIKIKAVAAFPKETAKEFSSAYGRNFRFRGNLLKIEPVSRELYLTGCRITEKGGEA